MSKVIERDGRHYRIRRGVVVEIPPEWVGVVTHPQTIAKRASKQPPGQRKPPAQTRKAREERAARRRESEGCDDGD